MQVQKKKKEFCFFVLCFGVTFAFLCPMSVPSPVAAQFLPAAVDSLEVCEQGVLSSYMDPHQSQSLKQHNIVNTHCMQTT